jgi:hypothetical protein
MIVINFKSNIDAAIKGMEITLTRQIPYGIAMTINDVLEQARERVITTTYANAFKVRNRRLAGVNFTVDRVLLTQRAGSLNTGMPRSLAKFKSGEADSMTGVLRQRKLKGGYREYFEEHAEGGTKRPYNGSSIAVPQDPDTQGMRTGTGRIKAREKPRRITSRRDTFLMKDKSGRKLFIAKRTDRHNLDFKYFFTKDAQIKKKFRFYEDSTDTILGLFSPVFQNYMDQIRMRSPFLAN